MTSPLILIPKTRELEIVGAPQQVAGWFRFQVKKRGIKGARIDTGWFPNLITNNGLNRIGNGGAWGTTCAVGTGNATPDPGDTSLQALLASTTNVVGTIRGVQNTPPYYGYRRTTWRFGEGAAAGNLSEVLVGWAANSAFSRALILDGEGNPTTITVLSDEYLDVTYEARRYPNPLEVLAGTLEITGSGTHDTSLLASRVNASPAWDMPDAFFAVTTALVSTYSGGIGAVTSVPSSISPAAQYSINYSAYTNGNYYRGATIVLGLSDGNASGGIRSIGIGASSSGTWQGFGAHQIEFDPVIPKDGTKILTINLRVPFARKTL